MKRTFNRLFIITCCDFYVIFGNLFEKTTNKTIANETKKKRKKRRRSK
jgi:hypothetical protein